MMLDNQTDHFIAQKDHILQLVNEHNFEEALTLLKFIRPLWEANDYLYKYKEIVERMERECVAKIDEGLQWKVRQKYEKTLEKIRICRIRELV